MSLKLLTNNNDPQLKNVCVAVIKFIYGSFTDQI